MAGGERELELDTLLIMEQGAAVHFARCRSVCCSPVFFLLHFKKMGGCRRKQDGLSVASNTWHLGRIANDD